MEYNPRNTLEENVRASIPILSKFLAVYAHEHLDGYDS